MRQVHLISHLFLQQGVLRSRVKSSAKKVHFRQGELDGACGAYSIAMALNIVGAFDADYLNKETDKVDFRTAEGKLHKTIHEWGLYPNGLSLDDCTSILDTFRKYVSYETFQDFDSILEALDNDCPVIVGIDYSGGGHWIVAVGYNLKEGVLENIYTLDPGSSLPVSAFWNGVLNLGKEKGKRYCYDYSSIDWCAKVKVTDAIALKKR